MATRLIWHQLNASLYPQVPGNIRRAEHFVQFLRRLLEYLRRRMGTQAVEQETPATFLAKLQEAMSIDGVPAFT